jgi:hypothetical protein
VNLPDVDPHVADALHAVLSAGKPQRFKVLTVVCGNDHVLGRVYRTRVGLVVVHAAEGRKRDGDVVDVAGVGPTPMPGVDGPRAVTVAYLLDPVQRTALSMQCRCTTALPYGHELLTAIENGKKRLRVS